VWECVGRCGK